MKNRLTINMIIDLAMFLAMVVTSISGIVIKIIAPLRRTAETEWIREMASCCFSQGMSRRVWTDIHLWGGVVMLALLVIHIALHWSMVDGFFKKHIASKSLRTTLYVVLLLLLIISVVPWLWAL